MKLECLVLMPYLTARYYLLAEVVWFQAMKVDEVQSFASLLVSLDFLLLIEKQNKSKLQYIHVNISGKLPKNLIIQLMENQMEQEVLVRISPHVHLPINNDITYMFHWQSSEKVSLQASRWHHSCAAHSLILQLVNHCCE